MKRLGITSQRDYYKLFKEDPRLPSNPQTYYINKGWISWPEFVGKETPAFYSTYEEAKIAVKRLRITKKEDYYKRYREDPGLPSNPNRHYKNKGWVSWPEFVGKETSALYPTYEEAKIAVKRLRITKKEDYYKRYREDPRLPSHPNESYKNKGWISWPEFVGKETSALYPTYEEAKIAVKRLRITLHEDYYKRYKEDPRLPSAPYRYYKNKGWINWFEFVGKEMRDMYPTYGEARNAVKKLGIIQTVDYHKRYKEDQRLPCNPDQYYKNKGWISWSEFFGKETPDLYPTYGEARNAVKRLGITSTNNYKRRYKEDPRLSSHPDGYYKNKGWISWSEFFGKKVNK